MNSKEEQLESTRKKLNEFQGLQTGENDFNRLRNMIVPVGAESNNDTPNKQVSSNIIIELSDNDRSTELMLSHNVPVGLEYKSEDNINANAVQKTDSLIALDATYNQFPNMSFNQMENFSPFAVPSEKAMNSEFFHENYSADKYRSRQNEGSAQGFTQEYYENDKRLHFTADSGSLPEIWPSGVNTGGVDHNSSSLPVSNHSVKYHADPKDFFEINFNSSLVSNDLSNAANVQTIETLRAQVSQLMEEKNNLLQILKKTEEFLKYKTDEAETMGQNASFLQSKVEELEMNFSNAESEIQNLKLKNEQLAKESKTNGSAVEELKKKFDSKEEKLLELQQKWILKSSECDHLGLQLQNVQSQLSSSLIKIQQLSVGESHSITSKVNDLQTENANLIHRVHLLEKNVEVLTAEKEQSSLNFHNYAQQCNNQLSSLSTEVRNLTNENQLLSDKNRMLEENIRVLETKKAESEMSEDNKEGRLTEQLALLMEENKKLQNILKEKTEDIEALQKEKIEKSEEIKQMHLVLQETKAENLKLAEERESGNVNQKLLAAMESDKVAAARAVAQNRKLKDQITELEEGFIKLSYEKLKLTDELSYEKHVKKEMESRMKELEAKNCEEAHDLTINKSENLDDLKQIIRQLEQDKSELLSRLNSKKVESDHSHCEEDHEVSHHAIGNEAEENKSSTEEKSTEENENSKLIVQQMEEKVKKTMNEIAALDEEKEKLEHLVCQLQWETETIGEYISLYQTQRLLMRQRNKEKDDQLMQLHKDKEELKSKLTSLNELVHRLLTEKGIECKEISDHTDVLQHSESISENTVEKIQTLISEIQATNLINNHTVAFKHCSCCSGRLIDI